MCVTGREAAEPWARSLQAEEEHSGVPAGPEQGPRHQAWHGPFTSRQPSQLATGKLPAASHRYLKL